MNPEMEPFDLAQHANLFEAFGISGREEPVRAVLEERVGKLGLTILHDTTGSLIGYRPGRGQETDRKKILVAASMDTPGIMITHVDERGFARFSPVGGLVERTLPGSRVRFENGGAGVINLETDGEGGFRSGSQSGGSDKEPTVDRMYVDVGAVSREEALAAIAVGESGSLYAQTGESNGVLFGSGIGTRACCLVLLLAAQQLEETDHDLYFLFAAQGGLDLRGAATSVWRVQPDLALMVGFAECGDLPPGSSLDSVKLGAGAAVKVMDGSIIVTGKLVQHLSGLARAESIPFQMEVGGGRRRPAHPVQLSGSGVLTGGVSLPVRHANTGGELCAVSDLQACIRLTAAFCRAGGV
jgi:endoglucanase